MVHIYSTNDNIPSDEEFQEEMQRKEKDAAHLLSLQTKADESELLSIEDGHLVYNECKKQSFIHRHRIRQAYKDGKNLWAFYDKSEILQQT